MLTVIAMSAGAGCRHPYQAEATLIGNGQYMIIATTEDSEAHAYQYAYSRANEICPNGYDVVDNKAGSTKSSERVAVFGRRTIESPEVTLVVRCKEK
jgi:hypothetical protein